MLELPGTGESPDWVYGPSRGRVAESCLASPVICAPSIGRRVRPNPRPYTAALARSARRIVTSSGADSEMIDPDASGEGKTDTDELVVGVDVDAAGLGEGDGECDRTAGVGECEWVAGVRSMVTEGAWTCMRGILIGVGTRR